VHRGGNVGISGLVLTMASRRGLTPTGHSARRAHLRDAGIDQGVVADDPQEGADPRSPRRSWAQGCTRIIMLSHAASI